MKLKIQGKGHEEEVTTSQGERMKRGKFIRVVESERSVNDSWEVTENRVWTPNHKIVKGAGAIVQQIGHLPKMQPTQFNSTSNIVTQAPPGEIPL